MQSIKINRQKLLVKIKKNRESHRAEFEKAIEGYRKQMIIELDKIIEEIKANRKIRRGVSIPEPIDKTDEYDVVIDMLEMCESDAIEISDYEFKCYARDEWDWMPAVSGSNRRYSS